MEDLETSCNQLNTNVGDERVTKSFLKFQVSIASIIAVRYSWADCDSKSLVTLAPSTSAPSRTPTKLRFPVCN